MFFVDAVKLKKYSPDNFSEIANQLLEEQIIKYFLGQLRHDLKYKFK